MSNKEAIVFLKNAIVESTSILNDLIKTKDRCERVDLVGEYYAEFDYNIKEIEAYRVAIKAIRENEAYRRTLNKVGEIVHKREYAFDGQEFGPSYCDLDNLLDEIGEELIKIL